MPQWFTPIIRLRQCIKQNILIFSVQHAIRMCGALKENFLEVNFLCL